MKIPDRRNLHDGPVWGASAELPDHFTTFTFTVDVSCFCTPPLMKFAENVIGTASPSGMLLSMSALLNCATSVLPALSTFDDTGENSVVVSGVLSVISPSGV